MESSVGFVNGCFDVLHIGHIRILEFAKSRCTHLIVGIDADTRIKELKGFDRPLFPQEIRGEILLALKSVDEVRIFSSSDELTNLIKVISPDIMVVGSDYKDKTVIGSEHAGQLLFFERIEGHSTSRIIECAGDRR